MHYVGVTRKIVVTTHLHHGVTQLYERLKLGHYFRKRLRNTGTRWMRCLRKVLTITDLASNEELPVDTMIDLI